MLAALTFLANSPYKISILKVGVDGISSFWEQLIEFWNRSRWERTGSSNGVYALEQFSNFVSENDANWRESVLISSEYITYPKLYLTQDLEKSGCDKVKLISKHGTTTTGTWIHRFEEQDKLSYLPKAFWKFEID